MLQFVAHHAVDREALTWEKWKREQEALTPSRDNDVELDRKICAVCPFTLLQRKRP
jgi:hypothetical protein